MKAEKEYLKNFKDSDRAQDAEVTSSGVYFSEADCLTMLAEFSKQQNKEMQDKLDKACCDECEGEGWVEGALVCIRPMHECCGGCFEQERCEKCEGTGFIALNLEEKFERLVDQRHNLIEELRKEREKSSELKTAIRFVKNNLSTPHTREKASNRIDKVLTKFK